MSKEFYVVIREMEVWATEAPKKYYGASVVSGPWPSRYQANKHRADVRGYTMLAHAIFSNMEHCWYFSRPCWSVQKDLTPANFFREMTADEFAARCYHKAQEYKRYYQTSLTNRIQ